LVHGHRNVYSAAASLDTFKVTRWDIVNAHVTWIDDNAAVVLYSWTGVGTFGEQPLASTMLASTVWIRRGGKWRELHHLRKRT
jgi:hypothetical protein